MKAFIGALALTVVLAASSSFAQGAAPAAPAPAAQQPAPPNATQVVPVAPFPVGTKYAFIDIQRIAGESAEGRAANTRVQTLQTQKVNELNRLNMELQALQMRLDAGGNVLNATAAADLQRQIDRKTTDIQRFTEDAQMEVTNLTNQLQADFEQKLTPIITAIAQEKGLHMIFSLADSGLIWRDPSLDITQEVITKFNLTLTPPAADPAPRATTPAAPPAGRGAAPAPAQPRPAAPAGRGQ